MEKLIIDENYWVTPNHILNSKELSFKAKGIFWYIQSKPSTWNFSLEWMSSQSKDWIGAIWAWVKELEEMWLLERIRIKNDDWSWGWVAYRLKANSGKPTDGKSDNGKSPDISKKDLSKKEVVRKKKIWFVKPTEQEVIDYFKEKWYMESKAKQAWAYYDAWDWKDARWNPVKSWKQKMISVRMKDEFKVKKVDKSDSWSSERMAERLNW